ncbi:DUF4174 domain-containing protein [Halodurantibacterium flavum]|uniref:DUF4174 domain-containing protein n=1 Tax=Halodurantibacterium flavum TaxID=1382802 RepID=A0ABW4S296_9RHOB
MKPVLTLLSFLILFSPMPGRTALAQTPDAPALPSTDTGAPVAETGLITADAAEITLADLQWTHRIIAVFADTPNDPQFQQQMRMLQSAAAGLDDRDVLVVTDTDPEGRSDPRQRLRPRGFSLVLVDKDGMVKQRKPSPWTAREIFHAIDRLPLRREEMLQQRPGRITN